MGNTDTPSNDVLATRLDAIDSALGHVRDNMATKEGQQASNRLIDRLEQGLADEREARIASVAAEATNRAADLAAEAVARSAGDANNRAAIDKVGDRLQTVEDRAGAQRWQIVVAILGAGFAVVFGIVRDGLAP